MTSILHRSTRLFVVPCLLLAVLASAEDAELLRVKLKVILITDDLSLKPVPRETFEIRSVGDDALEPKVITTSFDGSVDFELSPGEYQIRSMGGVSFEANYYTWELRFSVNSSHTVIELSNDNALVSSIALNEPRVDTMAATVFKAVRAGVVTVESEVGNGSGFIVDSSGLILTNEHVVSGSRFFAVRFSDGERYHARLLASDPIEDVAVLLVNPQVVESRPVLNLAQDSLSSPAAREGDPVFAIGSPLSQEGIISQGIISKVDDGVLISDVMIDHGSSGGPLLNANSEVLGITTFGEGKGISGIVRIWKVTHLLSEARSSREHKELPSARPLPRIPEAKYPTEALREIALSFDFDPRDYVVRSRKFDVLFLTPPAQIYRELEVEILAAKGRLKRRDRKGVKSLDPYDPLVGIKSWRDYVQSYDATVKIYIVPRVKATFGSSLGAALLGAPSLVKYRYVGEFDRVRLLRNGKEEEFIRMGRILEQQVGATTAGHIRDAAYGGFVEYLPEAFRPRQSSEEEVLLEIQNELKPGKTIRVDIPDNVLERMWGDFKPMRSR